MAEFTSFHINLGTTEEGQLLHENLDRYIRLTGYSRKRFFLMAAASLIGQQNDNPQLVMQIAEYLAGVGSLKGRPPNA